MRNSPLNSGLLDYQKDVRLINRGLHITKKTGDSLEGIPDFHPRVETHSQTKKKQRQEKTKKQTEQIIRWIAATKEDTHGILVHQDPGYEWIKDKSQTFDLTSSTYTVRFSIHIPSGKRLPASLDHPNFPITYRLIAMMSCADHGERGEMLCYSLAHLKLEHLVPVSSDEGAVQSKHVRVYVADSENPWKKFYGSLAADIFPSLFSSQLKAFLELPSPVLIHACPIPLRLILTNTSMLWTVSSLIIKVELVRKVLMTCGFGEVAEQQVVLQKHIMFGSPQDISVSLLGSPMVFDLSALLVLPSHCTCTVPSELTRHTFHLAYELSVALEVEGRLYPHPLSRPMVYYAHQENLVAPNSKKKQSLKAFKSYPLELSLPVIIDNQHTH
ncbi:hypothetical protein BY458DRAFT_517721 [Sporodiniella umbellata]|nr:hypothetical protein BY458DRAFT_517721 [Sporodiniella umbellata]